MLSCKIEIEVFSQTIVKRIKINVYKVGISRKTYKKYENGKSYSRDYFQQNKKGISEKRKSRRQKNPNCRLIQNLGSRIYGVLKDNIRTAFTKDLLGSDIEICRK